ncbi:MAG: TRAP transporter substrate-binding protein DctP [Dehalococcoidales bacterium]|nr:TRAP transporter substrate-binding protein DctP [Dehalococcoidales bacterium]
MKKGFKLIGILGALLIILIIASLILGSCTSNPSATTATTPAASTTTIGTSTTATTTTQPIVLSMAPINCGPPPAAGLTEVLSKWAESIQTKSNGRVQIDIYWAQALSPVNQIVNATSTGLADIGAVAQAQEPGKLPMSMVCQLPGFGDNYSAQCLAFWELMNQEPLLSEYAKFNTLPLAVNFVPDYKLISTKPISTAADIKGKKIACAGFIAQTIQSLGGVPIAMSPPEQYEGLQKGTIDGNGAPYSAILDFKFYEVAKYISDFNLGGRLQPILINKDSWNKLPADIQKIFKDSIPDIIQYNIEATLGKGEPLFPLTEELIQDNDIQLIKIADSEHAIVTKIQAGQADAWAAEQEKAGIPANKLLADYRALIEKYNAGK